MILLLLILIDENGNVEAIQKTLFQNKYLHFNLKDI
jgi:hypothetical protein